MADNKQYSTRRRACEQCVKSKRRCDTSQPCGRCCRRGIDCQYPASARSPSEKNLEEVSGPGSTQINGINYSQFFLANYSAPMYDTLATIVTYQLSKQTLVYCIRQMRSCLQSLVSHSETSFIKPSTWTSPGSSPVHDAFSIAACYSSRNEKNEEFVHDVILRKSCQIFRDEYWSFEEHLAAVQAMTILQIIQLFDGDIRLRTVAEMRRIVLQEQILRLQQRQEYEIPAESQSSLWLKWMFMESVRRVVIVHWFVEGMYGALKNGYCELVPLLATLPLSVDGKLWNTASEAEWEACSIKSGQATLPYAEAMPLWKQSIVEEGRLESLQDVLYAACKGNAELNSH